jgi:Ca-activated chloride channel family protein
MRVPAGSPLIVACAAALALHVVLAGRTGPQQPTFRTATEIVPLYVTVTDSQGRLVPDLERQDFIVLDNARPQELVFFENQVQPVTVIVMLDTSASMTLTLDLLMAAAEQFLIRLLPDDRGQVGAFNDKIELSGRFTSDRDELIAALKDLDFGNPTRLYDAVAESMTALAGVDGRRVVLVFTDGADTGSSVGQGTVLDRARREEVMIYAIGLESDYFDGVRRVRTRPDRGLKKLADETGGGYFELQKTDDLGPTFTRVAQELHSQYVLGFEPGEPDGKVHKLEVKVRRPGLNARARKSYVATGDRTSSGAGR